LSMIHEIGEDADLLARSDEWLDSQRRYISVQMSELADELGAILTAQKYKTKLQEKNLVAIIEMEENDVIDAVIRVMSLPDAIDQLDKSTSSIGKLNREAQYKNWEDDGHDVQTSSFLR
jgi:hypothetical protein